MASATLRDVILPYVDNDKQVEKELLLNYVTPLVKFVLVTSGKLEGLLASALTRHIEQSDARFMMHASMETLRIWQTLTASLGERFMNFVISSFNIFLAEEIKATKCALPTPSVCFDGDKVFQEAMAKEELGGTLANSIAAHNQLHAMIVQVAQASNTLGLTPPLETNAKTKKVIAQAQAALREAKDCAVYAQGVAILEERHTTDGVDKAKQFHTDKFEKYKHLEESFWEQIKQVKDYAIPPGSHGTSTPLRKNSLVSDGASSRSSVEKPKKRQRLVSPAGAKTEPSEGAPSLQPSSTDTVSVPQGSQKRHMKRRSGATK